MATPLKILVVGLNYAPEMVGIGLYTSGMAEGLAALGHDVRVVASQPYYPQWRIFPGYSAWRWTSKNENGVRITRCPHYVPRHPTGLRRILHHLSFAAAALFPALAAAIGQRPHVVVAVAPSIIGAPVARLAALLVGAKAWLHVQDFEVEAALATGLVREGLGSRLARWFERRVLTAFHRVSSISPKMCARLVQKGVGAARVVELRNWADTDAIRPLDRPSRYRETWGITTPHVALYSGNIANKQGLDVVVEAARLLSHRTDLTFVICGEGPNRASLEASAANLANIQFHDLQPAAALGELLGLATVHLMPQRAGAADLVLPSKLGNMLASGRPVIATTEPGTGLAAEVEGCGIVVTPGDAGELAAAIQGIVCDIEARGVFSAAARRRAATRYSQHVAIEGLDLALRALAA